MRAHEFLNEGKKRKKAKTSRVHPLSQQVQAVMPATYVIPQLPNQDPYLQYRFGVQMAAVRRAQEEAKTGPSKMGKESAFGENQIVVSYGDDAGPQIDAALHAMGLSGKKRITTKNSEEPQNIQYASPIKGFKGFK